MDKLYKDMENRTNNALEAYNRVYGEKFPKKPSLIEYAEVTEEESRAVEEKLHDVRRHHHKRPTYKEVTIPVIPAAYTKYAAAKNKLQQKEAAAKKREAAKKAVQQEAVGKKKKKRRTAD